MAVTEGWLTQPDGSKKYRTKDGKLHNTNPSNWTSYPGQPSIDAAFGTNLTKAGQFVKGLFTQPVTPSAGWTDAVQAQNNAIASGTQLAPNRPAGTEPGSVRPVEGAVDARGGNSGGNSGGSAAPTSTGRQSKRISPTGVEQTGTQTGIKPMTIDDVNSALGRIGSNQLRSSYSSNNLPATAEYEVPNTGADGPSQTSDLAAVGAGARAGADIPANSDVLRGIAAGKEVDTGATPDQTSGLGAALSDKASMRFTAPEEQGEGAKYAPPTTIDAAEIRRRRSFLDAEDSMQGLRNVEADADIYVAGGKRYTVNPNRGQEGQNDFIEINSDQRRTLLRGGDGAEQLRKSFVDRINGKDGESGDSATPAAMGQQANAAYASSSEKFADAPQILQTPVRQGGDNTSYFQTPTGSTVEPSTDFTDPPKVDMNGEKDYRDLVDKVKGNPYLR